MIIKKYLVRSRYESYTIINSVIIVKTWERFVFKSQKLNLIENILIHWWKLITPLDPTLKFLSESVPTLRQSSQLGKRVWTLEVWNIDQTFLFIKFKCQHCQQCQLSLAFSFFLVPRHVMLSSVVCRSS